MEEYSLICIDIGLHHLGICGMTVKQPQWEFDRVIGYDLMNITTFPHPPDMCRGNCCLGHTKTFVDWMEHIFQFYEPIFEGCTKILLERQPPQGFVVIEQLIFGKYRDKTELIHPCSMHKFFGINRLDYLERKQKVEEIALNYFNDEQTTEFLNMERRHDIADALCLGLFWISRERQKWELENTRKRIEELTLLYKEKKQVVEWEKDMNFDDFLCQFRNSEI